MSDAPPSGDQSLVDRVVALFWNDDESRPRAPWRILGALLLFVVAGIATAVALFALAAALAVVGVVVPAAGSFERTASMLSLGFVVTVAVLVAGWLVDRRRLADFGLRVDRAWWRDLGFGLALGALLMSLVFGVEYALDWVRITGYGVATGGSFAVRLASGVVVFLAVGFYEELMARGYLLTNVAEGLVGSLGRTGAVAAAVVLSSAVFGVLHAGNPNATVVSTVSIGLAGVMLALGYVMTGELAIPIGLHVTWNAFQGLVYGFPVSGNAFGVSVVGIEQQGPALVTGGQFGPEAGLIGIAAMLLGTLLIYGWARWHGHPGVDDRVTTPELRG